MTGLRTPLDSRPTPIDWIDVLVAAFAATAQIGGTAVISQLGQPERPPSSSPTRSSRRARCRCWSGIATRAPSSSSSACRLRLHAVGLSRRLLHGVPGVRHIWAAVAARYRLFALVAIGILSAVLVVAGFVMSSGHARDPEAAVWFAGWLVAAFVLGEVSRSRREYLEQVERRAIEAERTREEEARRRAGEERLRIARELHDVLTHHISVISIQAGVAVHLLDKEAASGPPDASTAQARQARDDQRVQPGGDARAPRHPGCAPRTGRGGAAASDARPGCPGRLVAGAGAAGLAVDVESAGERQPLPVGTDLAAYRIIQESLTNVARHAGADHARVSLQFTPEDLVVEVADDGRGVPVGARIDDGNGLAGMRERAIAVGGSLEAGPRAEGGFLVRARLPRQATS